MPADASGKPPDISPEKQWFFGPWRTSMDARGS
jgi:hypothetical protein